MALTDSETQTKNGSRPEERYQQAVGTNPGRQKSIQTLTSHKPLKSISHNFGHSFISLMNYINDDYFLGHLLKQARLTNLNKLDVDILADTASPERLLTKPIRDSIHYWCKWFPGLVNSSGSTMDYISKATMTIEFDLEKKLPKLDGQFENPFTCEIKIIDDRGREYKHVHSGWWYPET